MTSHGVRPPLDPGGRCPPALYRAGRIAVALTLVVAIRPLSAQDLIPVSGSVAALEGEALAGVVVEALGTYWSAVTGRAGRFELRLPRGVWRLGFSRIGYRSDTVEVAVADRPVRELRVRLHPVPVALEGLVVSAPRVPALGETVTRRTVRQVPPLGEADVFRAIVLLPTVSQPNDLKGRIHLAGGSSDETGVRLDGHPLQDPFHLLGLLGAFNVAALERADVLIHHVPPSTGGRLSGVIDLETRRPSSGPEREAVVSLLSSGLTLARPQLPGGVDLLAAGRITYLDKLASLLIDDIPMYGFYDALIRVGRDWGDWRLETLGFITRDVFREAEIEVDYVPMRWGEALAGVRIERTAARWRLRARTSFDRAVVGLDERPARSHLIRSRQDWWSAALEAARIDRIWQARIGVAFDRREHSHRWIAHGLIDEVFSPHTPLEYDAEGAQSLAALYGDASLRIAKRWTAAAGGRLWRSAARWYTAPQMRIGLQAAPGLEVDAALERRYQFDAQIEEPIEGSATTPLFLLETPRRADVAAVAARWTPAATAFGARASIGMQAFFKRYPDRPVLPDDPPGGSRENDGPAFPAFDRIAGRSIGIALDGQLKWEGGRHLQWSYTYQRARERLDGRFYPTAWDAPHSVALLAGTPVFGDWTFNLAFQAHSGRATTPVIARVFELAEGTPGGEHLGSRYIFGERNSIRVPAYQRLDVGLRRSWARWGADWTLSLQVLNLLFRRNPIDYDWTQYYGRVRDGRGAGRGRPGLPLLPSVGLEVRW